MVDATKDETNDAAAASPAAVRERCRAMHHDIREAIRKVLSLASQVKHREGDHALDLAGAMKELGLTVRRHIAEEQCALSAWLERLEPAPGSRRRALIEAHASEIDAVFNVEYYGSHLAMAEDAPAVARALLAALSQEETDVLAEEDK